MRRSDHRVQSALPIVLFLIAAWFIVVMAEMIAGMRAGTFSPLGIVWRAVLYFIPIGVAWGVANALVVGFLRVMYNLPNWIEAGAFWERLRSGNPAGVHVHINRRTFREDRARIALLRVGGPGKITVADQDVAVTEWNGRFQRVLGPGTHVLGRFEYVRAVLDLRQQEYRNYAAEARSPQEIIRLVTKDGIEITADVTLIYRIATDDQGNVDHNPMTELTNNDAPTLPTKAQPYPYGEDAVRRAAYAETVSGRRTLTWKERAIEDTLDTLRSVTAQYSLDKLVYPTEGGIKPYHTLQDKWEKQARQKLRLFGVRLIHARIDRLGLPRQVTEQMIRYWVAPHERTRQVELARLQARLGRDIELAQAEQNTAIARGIVDGMQQAQIEGSESGVTEEVVALRLAGALRTLQRRIAAQRG